MSGAMSAIYTLLAFTATVSLGAAAVAFFSPRVSEDQEISLLLTMLLLVLTAPAAG